jgi:glycosyl hydrolase family 123
MVLACAALAADGPAKADPVEAAAPTTVLDTAGFWRMHQTLKPPVAQYTDGLRPMLLSAGYLNSETPDPPSNWPSLEFDDSTWLRAPALVSAKTPYLARLSLRGRFQVADPSKVEGLKLSLDFHGGAVVWVNGREVARAHVPKGQPAADRVAEAYPETAFVTDSGDLITYDRWKKMKNEHRKSRQALRRRSLDRVAIPSSSLRKGVNVVAIEIVRAPYHKSVEVKKAPGSGRHPIDLTWYTCRLLGVRLTADEAEGLTPNVVRLAGLQAWNSNLLVGDFDMDFGASCEALRPIRIVGARGGWFSGKVVVGRDGPLRGLKATMSALCGPGGATIPPSASQVRYAMPWGTEHLARPYGGEPNPYPARPQSLSALTEQPADEIAVRTRKPGRHDLKMPPEVGPVYGAVVPVWVTVKVPRDIASGAYKGTLRIETRDAPPITVPVELSVADWAVPSTDDYRSWIELFQSTDTLSIEYKTPLWSERHFELIAKSMQFMGDIGSRTTYIPLICRTNLGNAESMVRWIPKGDGTYDYDFTVMDRYLDLVEKHIGKPKFVVFNVWDVYIIPKGKKGRGAEENAIRYLRQKKLLMGEGPAVTVLDPKTGATSTVYLPPYTDEKSRALWQPLLEKIREKLRGRGLEKAMMFGLMPDARPSREELDLFNEMAPEVEWVVHSHHGAGATVRGVARVGYQSRVWNISHASDRKRQYGWNNKTLLVNYMRSRNLLSFPATHWRTMVEQNIAGGQRGVGRIGADFWACLFDKRGRRVGRCWNRYPESSWRNLDLYSAVLAPGADGPIATTRYEILREGVQECEARIYIEQALLDAKMKDALGKELADRCQAALDERIALMLKGLSNLHLSGPHWYYATKWTSDLGLSGHFWFVGSGWQDRTALLFDLAAEVDARLKAEGLADAAKSQ